MKRGVYIKSILVISFLIMAYFLITNVNLLTIGRGGILTGKASKATNVSIFVLPSLPELIMISPQNKTYLINTSILLNYTATNADSIWYNIDNSANITATSPIYFYTSYGIHTIFLFANNSEGTTQKNASFTVNSSMFAIYSTKWQDSHNGSSTFFEGYPYEDMQNLTNIIFENTLYGKIFFLEAINLTNDLNPSDNILDLDSYINLSFNRIELNASALPNFNKPATLWFNNLTFTNPRILKDGSVCPSTICVKESYSGGMLRFNITSFSVYSVGETPVESPSSGG